MADQRFLNAYILGGVMKLFQDYHEDGERVKVTCAEAVEALQHTQSAIYSRLPMDFTEKLLPRIYQGEFQVFTQMAPAPAEKDEDDNAQKWSQEIGTKRR